MKRLAPVLLWSVLAAAFIGPGTVTTAASAGAAHGYALLWALVFSTGATLVLQEAAARITVLTGRDLGRSLRERYHGGARGALMLFLVVGAILVGCAAYEAGNILGAVAGAGLLAPLPPRLLTVLTALAAAGLLALGSPRRVALGLSVTVGVMGLGFLVTAVMLGPPPQEVLRGALWPSLPPGAGLLAVGLVGTTVVPYNLFLGSGLAAGCGLAETRFGLAVAVGLGGLISLGVVVVGAALSGPFGFEALAAVLAGQLGSWARAGFAAGLFAAGLSSAVTAPLAAALTARSLFAQGPGDGRWQDRSARFRGVWLAVLGVGVGFGLSGVRPIPVIVAAQALNGVLLPCVAVFLALAVNDRRRLGEGGSNGAVANGLLAVVVGVCALLGTSTAVRAGAALLGLPASPEPPLLAAGLVAGVALAGWVLVAVRRESRR